MFGGHGMFQDLQPIGLSMAAVGLLPVTLWPAVRFNFHPLRSTLVYCVLVLLLVCWSAGVSLQDRAAVLMSTPQTPSSTRFVAIISISHIVGLLMVPLLWAEAHRMQCNQDAFASLMASFGHLNTGHCRCARALAWLCVSVGFVVSPLCSFLWLTMFEGSWRHGFAHSYVQLTLYVVCCGLSCQLHCLRAFADRLRAALAQELAQPYPSARRLSAYRHAWVQLRDVTRGAVVTPLTAVCMLLFVLLMTVMGSYLCLQCFLQKKLDTGLNMLVLGLILLSLLLVVCDAAHRTADAVSKNFLHPLETFSGSLIGEAAMDEIHTIRDVVASSPVVISAGGYWTVDRGTIGSVLAACVSYLIVLIQFRQAYEASSSTSLNQSAAEPTGSSA